MLSRLPSPFAIYALAAAALFGIITAARGLVDSDYYWHVTAGRLIAERGVMSTDPFSYTWGGQPWVMHEWLGELIIHWLVSLTGVGVATFVFGVVSVAGPLVLAYTLHRRGVPMLPLALSTALVLYIFTNYATIRPQALSWLFLGLLLSWMLTLRPEHRWRPWLVVPFFVVWANLHGLYVVGGGVLAVYVLFTVAGRTPMSPRRWTMVSVLAGAFLASMLTPAGPAGLLYPLRYVDAGDWGLAHISEWQSPDFQNPAHLGLLLLIVAVLANGMRATPGWLTTFAVAGIVGALLAIRNAPLGALLALPTLALGLGDRLPARVRPRPERVRLGRRLMEIGVAVVVVVAAALIVPRLPAVDPERTIPRNFPVAAVDELARVAPDSNVLAEYHWGGYVIHRLYDQGGRVFVDGRNDMYDEAILDDYVTIRNAGEDWQQVLDAYGTDAILLPPETALVSGAAQSAGWCEAHRDSTAVLLLRSCP
jgi:hypothetical protein